MDYLHQSPAFAGGFNSRTAASFGPATIDTIAQTKRHLPTFSKSSFAYSYAHADFALRRFPI